MGIEEKLAAEILLTHRNLLGNLQAPIRNRPKRAGQDLLAGQVLTLLAPDGNVHGFQNEHGLIGHEFYTWIPGSPATMNVAVAMRDLSRGSEILDRDIKWLE